MGLGPVLFMISVGFIGALGIIEETDRRDHEEKIVKYKTEYKKSFKNIYIPSIKEGDKFCAAPIYIDEKNNKLPYYTLTKTDRKQGIIANLKCIRRVDTPCLKYLRVYIGKNRHTFKCTQKIIFEKPKMRKVDSDVRI